MTSDVAHAPRSGGGRVAMAVLFVAALAVVGLLAYGAGFGTAYFLFGGTRGSVQPV